MILILTEYDLGCLKNYPKPEQFVKSFKVIWQLSKIGGSVNFIIIDLKFVL